MRSYNYADAILLLRPEAIFTIHKNEYSTLKWLGGADKPTEEEIQAKIQELEAAEPMRLLREERDTLLRETDWWVLPDRTSTQEQLDYRQALRDITNTYTSLDDVVWPTKPA